MKIITSVILIFIFALSLFAKSGQADTLHQKSKNDLTLTIDGQILVLKKPLFKIEDTPHKKSISFLIKGRHTEKALEDLTEKNLGKQMTVKVNGKEIISPTIRDKITGGKLELSFKDLNGWFAIQEYLLPSP